MRCPLEPGSASLAAGSTGEHPPTPEEITRFWRSTWRYFESNDRNFEHPTPIQGSWTIDGIDLPDEVLRKVYGANAARLFGLEDEFEALEVGINRAAEAAVRFYAAVIGLENLRISCGIDMVVPLRAVAESILAEAA